VSVASVGYKASVMCERAAESCWVVELALPHNIRLPFGIHLTAAIQIWVGLLASSKALIVAQMSVGKGLGSGHV
jgi:hypothetical protein